MTTRKLATDRLMVIFVSSPDGSYDQLYVSNYALRQVRDELLRIDGIGDIDMQGARDYAMRVWLDPGPAWRRNRHHRPRDVISNAIQAQNCRGSPADTGRRSRRWPTQSPVPAQPSPFRGRLADAAGVRRPSFIRAGADGRLLRLHDIGHGSCWARQSYTTRAATLQGRPAGGAGRPPQRPGSECTGDGGKEIRTRLAAIALAHFPCRHPPPSRLRPAPLRRPKAMHEAEPLTIAEAVVPRRSSWSCCSCRTGAPPPIPIPRHPGLADRHLRGDDPPFGFTLNVLTPVRPGAGGRHRRRRRHRGGGECRPPPADRKKPPVQATPPTRDHAGGRRGALLVVALVLCAVFVPTAFLEGITGRFFRQFAVTIAVATAPVLLLLAHPQPGAGDAGAPA